MSVGDRSNEIMELFDQLYDLDAGSQDDRLNAIADSDPALGEAVRKLILSKRKADQQGFLDPANKSATLLNSPAIGQRIGPFEIEEVLASGGMGIVYRARHVHLDRPIALKVPHMLHPNKEQLFERLRREGKALARLDHPHIVKVYDAGVTEEGVPFIAMGLLEGESLAVVRAGQQVPEKDVIRWGIQLAEALDYLHERQIYHRDIKSANILLDDAGDAILADFGIAHVGDFSRITQMLPGTPAYMCPEQLRGRAIDGRCDLYSLGLVMYELLAGKPADGLSLKVHRPGVSDRLFEIIQKCTEHNPAHRYQTGEALARTLRFDEPETVPQGKTWVPVAFIGVVVALIAIAGFLYFSQPAPSPVQAAPSKPPLIESIVDQATSEADLIEALAGHRLDGTLSFGQESHFFNSESCYVFVFEDKSTSPVAVLKPANQAGARENMLNGQIVEEVDVLLDGKTAIWMLVTP